MPGSSPSKGPRVTIFAGVVTFQGSSGDDLCRGRHLPRGPRVTPSAGEISPRWCPNVVKRWSRGCGIVVKRLSTGCRDAAKWLSKCCQKVVKVVKILFTCCRCVVEILSNDRPGPGEARAVPRDLDGLRGPGAQSPGHKGAGRCGRQAPSCFRSVVETYPQISPRPLLQLFSS